MAQEMKLKELIERLIDLMNNSSEDLPVFTSIDDEGNGYRPVYEGWVGIEGYSEDDYYGGIEVGILELTPELEAKGYTEEDVKKKACVIIG